MIRTFCIFLVVVSVAADSNAQSSANRFEMQSFLDSVQPEYGKEHWFGKVDSEDSLAKCGFAIKKENGSLQADGISLFIGDVNNDGKDEYVLVDRCGGSAPIRYFILKIQQRQ